MDWNLRLHRAFTIQVEIGALSTDGTNYEFPIIAGSLETESAFLPPLKIDTISGLDKAVLIEDSLHLHVCVDLQLQNDAATQCDQKVKLLWNGTVVVGEREKAIMRGDFLGETDFGNPLATFKFDVGNEDLVELKNRLFVGQGRFVKNERQKNLHLEYQVSEIQANKLPLS